jgi:hypothetical protein
MAASMPFPRPADSTEIRMAVNALPTVFEIGKEREFGRGERASASLTQPPLRFLMINRTLIEGRDEWLAAARRLA